jgi:hypothetical protein
MPLAATAFGAGDLGMAKLRLLAEAERLAPEAFARDESMLVTDAVGLRVDETKRLLAFWLAHVNPESDDERNERRHRDRNVHLSQTFQKGWVLDGDLPDEHGEILNNAIERWERKLYEAERAACDATGEPMQTTASQRRADALVEIAKQALVNDEGNPMNVPSITGIIDITRLRELCDTAEAQLGASNDAPAPPPAATGEPHPTDRTNSAALPGAPTSTPTDTTSDASSHHVPTIHTPIRSGADQPSPPAGTLTSAPTGDHPARGASASSRRSVSGPPVGETEHGLPISPETALRFLCDCHLSRVVTGPASAPIDLGLSARLASPAQRRALAVRDRGCTFPGCDRPPGWSSAHHIVHWVNDGPTDLHNLTLLCNFHHHRVHECSYGCTRAPDGTLTFTRPDGTTLEVPKTRIGHDAPEPLDAYGTDLTDEVGEPTADEVARAEAIVRRTGYPVSTISASRTMLVPDSGAATVCDRSR